MRQDSVDPGEKTCIKSTGNIGLGECSSLAAVDVKDGKIVRIRSFPYTWKYRAEEFQPWKLEARGKTFEPALKSMPHHMGHAYEKRVYAPSRTPLSLEESGLESRRRTEPAEPGDQQVRADLVGRNGWL